MTFSVNLVVSVVCGETFSADSLSLGMTFSVSVELCVSLSATCSADSLTFSVLVARANFLLCSLRK